MTALTANQSTLMRDGKQFEYGVKSGATKIYQGALVQANGNYAEPAAKAQSKTFLGIALLEASAGTSDGDNKVTCRRQIAAKFKTVTGNVPALNATAYVEDDQTVHSSSSGRSALGKVVAVESDGVWVLIE